MTTAEFERQIGVSGGYISNISKSIQPDKLEKISKIYPDLNIEWLLIGKGAMINNIVRLNIDKEKIQDMQNVPDYIEIPEQAKDIIERVLQGTSKNSDNPVMVAEPSTEYGENKISQVKVETRPRVPYTACSWQSHQCGRRCNGNSVRADTPYQRLSRLRFHHNNQREQHGTQI